MVPSVLKIFVSVSMLIACVNSKAESGGDPQRLPSSIVTTNTDADQGDCFYQSQVFLNPPKFESSCNCTTIRALVSAELKDTKRQLGQLQGEVSDQGATISSEVEDAKRQLTQLHAEVSNQGNAVSSELEDTKHQLKKIVEAVQDLGDNVKKLSDNSPLQGCSEVLATGVYTIQPGCNGQKFKVYCDMETDGGGWTVFQRRWDGTMDFYRSFSEYSQGFGDLEGEFWLGNQKLHLLTALNDYELRVDIADFEGNSAYAFYDSFSVGHLTDNYTLSIGGCSGTAGDSLSYHNGMPFSTKDRDNDHESQFNCAETWHGAWWYNYCYHSNLNGEYLGEADGKTGIVWKSWKPEHYSLKTTEMKIRIKS